jgi:quercetin dioxygenase-like cupin family protein
MAFVELVDLPELEIADGIRANVVTTDTVTVLHVRIDKGALLPEHSHYNEQVVNVIEGELELTVEGKTFNLMPGNVMVLEPNVVHSGKAVKACKVIDIFHPVRKDFIGSSFGGYPSEKK